MKNILALSILLVGSAYSMQEDDAIIQMLHDVETTSGSYDLSEDTLSTRGLFDSDKKIKGRVAALERLVRIQSATTTRSCNCADNLRRITELETQLTATNRKLTKLELDLKDAKENGIGLGVIAGVCLLFSRCC